MSPKGNKVIDCSIDENNDSYCLGFIRRLKLYPESRWRIQEDSSLISRRGRKLRQETDQRNPKSHAKGSKEQRKLIKDENIMYCNYLWIRTLLLILTHAHFLTYIFFFLCCLSSHNKYWTWRITFSFMNFKKELQYLLTKSNIFVAGSKGSRHEKSAININNSHTHIEQESIFLLLIPILFNL